MDTATTEIYTLSLHDALPISRRSGGFPRGSVPSSISRCSAMPYGTPSCAASFYFFPPDGVPYGDRKSTRLNSSHMSISYAVFCLKKKKKTNNRITLSQHRNHA